MMRYFIGFLLTIGLIILLIVLLVGGGGSSNNPQVGNTAKPLVSYAGTDAQVKLTIDGPINADQTHQQVRITVNKDQATFEQVGGYNGNVVNTKTYTNNQNSYANFLRALGLAGYTKGDTTKTLSDERGYCPSGDRYVFELQQGGNELQRFWATGCGGTKTYLGSLGQTLNLFEAQIPDFNNLTQNITNIDF